MSNKLSELFAVPKGDLKTVTRISGHAIFTSSDLKRKYLQAIGKVGKTAPIYEKIINLVDRGILTPVYSTDKALKSIAKQQPIEIRGFAGMVTEDKKIYIFVEADANFFSFTSNEDLATVTLHELIHYVASFHLQDFYKIFKKQLEEYYTFYFSRLFNCNHLVIKTNKAKQLTELVKFINFKLEPQAFRLSNKLLTEYYQHVEVVFRESSTLSDNVFNLLLTQLLVFITVLQKLVISGSTQYFAKTAMEYKQIIAPLYVAYKHTISVNPMVAKNLCFQELWSTSEVIAIPAMAKTPKMNVYQAIKKL